MLQGHGDDGYLHNKAIEADFSTNVYHGGAPAGLKAYLFERWEKVMRYPEVIAESLAEKIAAQYNLSNDHILVTNGSTESIYLIAQAYKHKKSAIVIPAFAEYEDACRMHGHQLRFVLWEDFPAGIADAELVFICNPNNPTGQIIPDIGKVIANNPTTLFIVDEAFIEFTLAITSVAGLVVEYENLIVLRSMTKAYAIPGLRLGYIIAPPSGIRLLKSEKLPWTVNAMALEAGHFIFDRLDRLTLPLNQIFKDKADLISALEAAPLKIHSSHTHFFVAETLVQNAALLKKYLLQNFNILIRDAGNFRGLSENHIRIATLSPVKNQMLINAFSEWKHL
jgi:threonine-phosphate decarboxylase